MNEWLLQKQKLSSSMGTSSISHSTFYVLSVYPAHFLISLPLNNFSFSPPLTFPSQTALRAQRPLLPDRAGGRLHPALLLRPGALPPGAVGGLGRAQHAQVLHTHHARIHSPGESVAVALQKGKKKFCSYCPPLFLVREALCWVRFTCAREQIALGEIG